LSIINPRANEIYKNLIIVALKKLAARPAMSVVAIGKSGLQPLHPADQAPPRSADNQVELVGHHAKSFQHPTALLTRMEEAFFKGLVRLLVDEQVLEVIPTVDHMINPIAKRKSLELCRSLLP
jgi:hypothetical protein